MFLMELLLSRVAQAEIVFLFLDSPTSRDDFLDGENNIRHPLIFFLAHRMSISYLQSIDIL